MMTLLSCDLHAKIVRKLVSEVATTRRLMVSPWAAMAHIRGLLIFLCLTSTTSAGRARRQAGCKCRPQIQCVNRFDSLDEMARNSCELRSGLKGLCCTDIKKRRAPPPADFVLRTSDDVRLPENLGEKDISEKLFHIKAPGLPWLSNDKATKSQRLFTKGRKADGEIRNTALRLLSLVDEFELDGFGLRRADDGFDASNSIGVEEICPWTNKNGRRPNCGETREERKKYKQWRSVDGSCNNEIEPLWGMASTPQQRILDNDYSQPGDQPRVASDGRPLPSARLVTTTAFVQGDTPNRRQISTLFMQMAQFIDHDVTHTPATAPEEACCKADQQGRNWLYPNDRELRNLNRECFPIEIPRNDTFWGPKRRTCMQFSRADPSPAIPKCSSSAGREPANAITHWLDASNVYGSTDEETLQVRDTQDRFAFLKASGRGLGGKSHLPKCEREFGKNDIEACGEVCKDDLPNGGNRHCVFAGDFRVNEQPGLSTMHTLWVREHNRVAAELMRINPRWDLERVFQEARRIVIATWQNIIFNEWLPIVLGQTYMKSFSLFPLRPGQGYAEDYDSSIDPRINAEFSGAAFRFGHSMVPGLLQVMRPSRTSQMRLRDVFFDPSQLADEGFVDGIMLGMALTEAPAWDPEFSNDLTNHLFEEEETPGSGMDLVSLNIQRGRDLGLNGYNAYRKICASGKFRGVRTFNELAQDGYMSRETVRKLSALYRDVDDIDLFVGGLHENPHNQALLGPTFLCIIGDQFSRFKIADRFWFENGNDEESRFSLAQLDSLRDTSMARLICDNTNIREVQPLAFRVDDGRFNSKISCNDINMLGVDLSLWKE